ncbi:tetratricopeptide repeat protein [Rugamonas sp. CCM 8940]|uniref:tetratricopeptide repeat protein n=1 Tax=Rugamonas sp. CCM 8940 TaxID=2765359 RepID=UPI0018F2CC35|nr:tetratricopeptide repeat protein [Rugamonas sp. CCM 8940]MBJ7313305.1 tetratricopeptide repeat protein [Rugamonas sp. CCM 8940]
MRRVAALLAPLALTLALAAAPAQAQRGVDDAAESAPTPPVPTPAPAPTPAPPETPRQLEPDLYLEAMQAIAEGRNNDASSTLARMLAYGPRHAGEWLDLALLQCALGHADEAEQLFQHIETRFDPPQGIRDIIVQQRQQGCAQWRAQRQWSLNLARGHERNVNQGVNLDTYNIGGDGRDYELEARYRPQADRYTTVALDLMSDLTQNGDLGFVQLYARHYDRMDEYNTISLFAGADHPWRYRHWRLRTSALVGALSLGGRLYQAQGQLQLRVTLPLALPPSLEVSVLGGLSHVNYRTLSDFDSNISELRGMLAYRREARQAQLSLGWLNDHAVSARPGGNRAGWSLGLYGRLPLGRQFEGELDLTRQHWVGSNVYSPGLIDQLRRQDNTTLRAALSYPLGTSSALQLEWRQVRNRENIPIFQYDNKVLQLSWRWHGGR